MLRAAGEGEIRATLLDLFYSGVLDTHSSTFLYCSQDKGFFVNDENRKVKMIYKATYIILCTYLCSHKSFSNNQE